MRSVSWSCTVFKDKLLSFLRKAEVCLGDHCEELPLKKIQTNAKTTNTTYGVFVFFIQNKSYLTIK